MGERRSRLLAAVATPVELWPVSASTGWGNYGLGLALGLTRLGRTVVLPHSDLTGVPPLPPEP